MNKEKRINNEIKRLNKIFNDISKQKKEIINELIKRGAFLLIIAEDMEQEISTKDSVLETTINASQQFVKANPLFKEYRDTVKSYQAVIKQLTDLVKEETTASAQTVNPLIDFIGK